ncbi:hypothetical protein [Vibrio gallaecicus]|nr:hypothetical protein [Vibrio gallaecicus]MDN3614243.1 hypothetical protein [Vibrio gallaecicus]
MREQITQLGIGKLILNVEVDSDQHTFKRRVVFFNRFGGFIKAFTDVVL